MAGRDQSEQIDPEIVPAIWIKDGPEVVERLFAELTDPESDDFGMRDPGPGRLMTAEGWRASQYTHLSKSKH